ncbi:MAG: Gfo/Idh/MocA family oxidoreductase, partial [Bacteroidota bacterium]
MKKDRRDFITKSATAVAGVTLASPLQAAPLIGGKKGANEKIRVGFIGVGNRGSQLLGNFMENDDVEVAALCDVYQPYTTRNRAQVHQRYVDAGKSPKMGETFDKRVKQYEDFRELLDDKEIDAVCIATPDHWHAIQTIQALEAGKHVYVEKPLTITIKEGRAMVDAQKRTGKICAVGLNRRGSSIYQ